MPEPIKWLLAQDFALDERTGDDMIHLVIDTNEMKATHWPEFTSHWKASFDREVGAYFVKTDVIHDELIDYELALELQDEQF